MLIQISVFFSKHTAIEDYTSIEDDIEFTSAVSLICTNISIENDGVLENNETFTLNIATSDASVVFEVQSVTICIKDNDSELYI